MAIRGNYLEGEPFSVRGLLGAVLLGRLGVVLGERRRLGDGLVGPQGSAIGGRPAEGDVVVVVGHILGLILGRLPGVA